MALTIIPKANSGQTDPLNGFTPQQVALAFEQIAGKSNQLIEFLRATLGRMDDDADRHFADVDIAVNLLEVIGAIADRMTGNSIVGSYDYWLLGYQFDQAAKSLQGEAP